MKLYKRSLTSIFRQPIKTLIFFIIIVLVSMLTAASILARQAIVNTELNLRRRMPAVTTIMQDSQRIFEESGEWPSFEILMPDTIREIGQFAQVADFDYSIDVFRGITASGLKPWQDLENRMYNHFMYDMDLGVEFIVEGVSSPNFINIRESFIELCNGRTFTEYEFPSLIEPFPVVISKEFAQINNLSIDSEFEIQIIGFPNIGEGNQLIEDRTKEPVLSESYMMKIIGIFEPMLPQMPNNNDFNAMHQFEFIKARVMHRLYLPNIVAEYLFNVAARSEFNPSNLFVYNFFSLHDPVDFGDFAHEVENMDGHWQAFDFSTGFKALSTSLNNIQEVMNLLLLIAIGASIIIICLVLFLFLRERKKEVGIYLALGANKKSIFVQILSEFLPLIMIGMVVSLFIGNLVAEEIATNMLRQNLMQDSVGFLENRQLNQLESFGYRFELTSDEMFYKFDLGIETTTAIKFFTVGLATTTIATIIPIHLIVNTNPKKLLL